MQFKCPQYPHLVNREVLLQRLHSYNEADFRVEISLTPFKMYILFINPRSKEAQLLDLHIHQAKKIFLVTCQGSFYKFLELITLTHGKFTLPPTHTLLSVSATKLQKIKRRVRVLAKSVG